MVTSCTLEQWHVLDRLDLADDAWLPCASLHIALDEAEPDDGRVFCVGADACSKKAGTPEHRRRGSGKNRSEAV